MKFVAFLWILLALAIVLAGALLLLERGGAFSAEKCAKSGGEWDDSLELCRGL